MNRKLATLTIAFALILTAGSARATDDPNSGDDTPGCTPWLSGPVNPGDCGYGEPDEPITCTDGWTLAEDGTCVNPHFYDIDGDSEIEGQEQTIDDPAPIMEDDPRWDCHTMGNLICGPDVPAPVPATPQVSVVPRGAVSAGSGSTATTFSN